MNYKNRKIVERIANYICETHPLYSYDAVKTTIEHCFDVKSDHHLPDKSRKGVLVIEDAIYLKSVGEPTHYQYGCLHAYMYRVKGIPVSQSRYLKQKQYIIDSINGTLDILMNASNINNIITKWKQNKAEAYQKYYAK